MSKTVLVTGAAGFIGFHLVQRLCKNGYAVVGYDNLNSYYDVSLKQGRLSHLKKLPQFSFHQADLKDKAALDDVFKAHTFDYIVNLAAQAGVRYSLERPQAYIDSNITGFLNILECCRQHQIGHLVYASTSSVYGLNGKFPFTETDTVDHPISFYAASKKSNELMAHVYSHLFAIPTTGLRFFTAYGPWGRPDMALFKFASAIMQDRPFDVYNHGEMRRDFTFVEDIVDGIERVMVRPPEYQPHWDATRPNPSSSSAPYRVYNIGNSKTVELMYVISLLEKKIGRSGKKNFLPLQAGDVIETCADITSLKNDTGFTPKTSIEEGIERYLDWFIPYYKTAQH